MRCAARGSGAGSLVNYLLGISDVDPIEHRLLMERFLSPLRQALPDIDLDVESARRTEVYERILDRYGGERCTCVSMMDTYRARHAIRDTGAALGLPPDEIDTIAKAFPHIRASQIARPHSRDLPELRASRTRQRRGRSTCCSRLAERLDGLPRHIALHPCGVLLSDPTLLDRTPVEASWLGFPMSQFDKDDVEDARAAQARRARHPDAVRDRARDRGGRAGRWRRRRHRRDPARRPGDVRADPVDPHARHVPDRVTGSARAGRQVRARDVRRHHHRHLAVPARAGEKRHGDAVPRGATGLEAAAATCTRTCATRSSRPAVSSSSTSRCSRSSR